MTPSERASTATGARAVSLGAPGCRSVSTPPTLRPRFPGGGNRGAALGTADPGGSSGGDTGEPPAAGLGGPDPWGGVTSTSDDVTGSGSGARRDIGAPPWTSLALFVPPTPDLRPVPSSVVRNAV